MLYMRYEPREFSKTAYNRSDEYVKSILKNYLICKGHTILKEEEDYNHDLVTMINGKKCYFEFEMKRNYPFTTKESYRFNTVSFLGRKERLHKIKPFYYFILCYETNHVVYCHSSEIFKDEYREKVSLNKYSRKGTDEMFRVPKSKCSFFKAVK